MAEPEPVGWADRELGWHWRGHPGQLRSTRRARPGQVDQGVDYLSQALGGRQPVQQCLLNAVLLHRRPGTPRGSPRAIGLDQASIHGEPMKAPRPPPSVIDQPLAWSLPRLEGGLGLLFPTLCLGFPDSRGGAVGARGLTGQRGDHGKPRTQPQVSTSESSPRTGPAGCVLAGLVRPPSPLAFPRGSAKLRGASASFSQEAGALGPAATVSNAAVCKDDNYEEDVSHLSLDGRSTSSQEAPPELLAPTPLLPFLCPLEPGLS
ncbi:hypothetical protein J1605_002352 [Eschrichtius robustus]|uniref:Uncharacterized protein n=1 Tax=Eschrichtius robustus TaxID=9764 RepID=A0AB34HXU8_ESCRO|nr:hypothetical protein J1605_002352 [Eschrichtius robustus]